MRISILDVQGYQFRDLDFNSNWNIGHIDKRKIQNASMRFSFLQKIFRYGFTLIATVIDLKLPLSGSKWFYTLPLHYFRPRRATENILTTQQLSSAFGRSMFWPLINIVADLHNNFVQNFSEVHQLYLLNIRKGILLGENVVFSQWLAYSTGLCQTFRI